MTTASAFPEDARGTATFKARDVEELVDFYLHRRVANWVVRLLAPTSVQPNQVTIASGAVALIAGCIIAFSDAFWQLALGTGLFFFSVVLDCSDGQLARHRGTSSFAGRALDGWVDVVSTASIFLGQFAFMMRHDVGFWVPFALGWAAGYALKWHAHTYDHVKNVYLLNTESDEKGEEAYPSLEAIDREYEEHRAAGRRILAAFAKEFRTYTIAQRKAAQARENERRAANDSERLRYRAVYRTYMRLWTFNGLGTHLFLLMVGTLLATFDPRAPLVVWIVILAPMTLFAFCLMAWRPQLDARYDAGSRSLTDDGQPLS